MAMADGNTAALRQYEAKQRDRQEPTDSELEDFINNWMDEKQKEYGLEFLTEPLAESSAADQTRLFEAYKGGDSALIGIEVKSLVEKYWRPKAERDAEDHDFTPAPPCRCRGDCTC